MQGGKVHRYAVTFRVFLLFYGTRHSVYVLALLCRTKQSLYFLDVKLSEMKCESAAFYCSEEQGSPANSKNVTHKFASLTPPLTGNWLSRMKFFSVRNNIRNNSFLENDWFSWISLLNYTIVTKSIHNAVKLLIYCLIALYLDYDEFKLQPYMH